MNETYNVGNANSSLVSKPSRKRYVFFILFAILILGVIFLIRPQSTGKIILDPYVADSVSQVKDSKPSDVYERSPQDTEVLNKLLDEANSLDITVDDETVEDFIVASLDAYQMSEQELISELQTIGITYDRYKDGVASQLRVAKLIQENVNLQGVKVTDDEVEAFLEEEKEDLGDLYANPEQLNLLKRKVRSSIMIKKQTELVDEYIATLG